MSLVQLRSCELNIFLKEAETAQLYRCVFSFKQGTDKKLGEENETILRLSYPEDARRMVKSFID